MKSYLYLVAIFAGTAMAQQSAPPPSAAASTETAAAANSDQNAPADPFPELRKSADDARKKWQALDHSVFDQQIPVLKDPCSPKIPKLIDSVSASMGAYLAMEKEYARVWSERGTEEIQQVKSTTAAANKMNSDLQDILKAEQDDFNEVSRRYEELKKLGPQADEVAKEAKDLIDQMTDSQAKMAKTKAQIDDITASSKSSQDLIAIREAAIREYMPQLEAEAIAGKTYYLNRTKTFQARCFNGGVKTPPLPKIPQIDFGNSQK